MPSQPALQIPPHMSIDTHTQRAAASGPCSRMLSTVKAVVLAAIQGEEEEDTALTSTGTADGDTAAAAHTQKHKDAKNTRRKRNSHPRRTPAHTSDSV